jgi:hypothetical protein
VGSICSGLRFVFNARRFNCGSTFLQQINRFYPVTCKHREVAYQALTAVWSIANLRLDFAKLAISELAHAQAFAHPIRPVHGGP